MVVKEKIGIIVSDKMLNTRIVAVSDRIVHKQYKKVVTTTKRYAVHDSEFNSKVGDKVRIKQIVPISKTKTWSITSILRKSST
jgi:small subunit ribosomal protein S17|tara:strand:+ start:5493 stop:5741 length:249 start_codon:yes stop_codon:yes gene_type:complete